MSDEKLRAMLRDLGRALTEAIIESPEIGRSLKQIRGEGYSLHLLLDCTKDEERPERLCLPAAVEVRPDSTTFRIDTTDLSFLRSIGIDPTRRLRRRRGS